MVTEPVLNDGYILVTPAKNEGENLPFIIKSVTEQAIRPKIWMIIDDGSTDNTPGIIRNAESAFDWIRCITLGDHPRDITFHYSYVCKKGFDAAVRYCDRNEIAYQFIGLLDADTMVGPDFFISLMDQMKEDPLLGIVSGGIYHIVDGEPEWNASDLSLPAGTGRLWRKDCFFESGGYMVEPSPDSISNVKAVLRGWKIRKFKDIRAIERRPTSSSEGLWKGWRINGEMSYYLNKHPALILFAFLDLLIHTHICSATAFLYGYLSRTIRRGPRIPDPEIRDYFWNKRLREYLPFAPGRSR